MDYLFGLANASLTLRVIEYLRHTGPFALKSLTVVHQINGWIVRIRVARPLSPDEHGNFWAFLSELGVPYQPDIRLQMAFWSLDAGESAIQVMRHYQLAIVSHGMPDITDIEEFRQAFVRGLGYCPETLA
ncbi:MAG: hypothetical protein VKL42_01850 [Snowella sp.]|nr:hypothetical protein [Snowella sp.]